MEDLGDRWQQLKLSKEEDVEIMVKKDQLTKEINKGKISIIEKLHAEKSISKDII